jgi:hypothetical protein
MIMHRCGSCAAFSRGHAGGSSGFPKAEIGQSSNEPLPGIWFGGLDIRLARLPLRNLPVEPGGFVAESSAWAGDRLLEVAAVVS